MPPCIPQTLCKAQGIHIAMHKGSVEAERLPCGRKMHAAFHAGRNSVRSSVLTVTARGAARRLPGLARARMGEACGRICRACSMQPYEPRNVGLVEWFGTGPCYHQGWTVLRGNCSSWTSGRKMCESPWSSFEGTLGFEVRPFGGMCMGIDRASLERTGGGRVVGWDVMWSVRICDTSDVCQGLVCSIVGGDDSLQWIWKQEWERPWASRQGSDHGCLEECEGAVYQEIDLGCLQEREGAVHRCPAKTAVKVAVHICSDPEEAEEMTRSGWPFRAALQQGSQVGLENVCWHFAQANLPGVWPWRLVRALQAITLAEGFRATSLQPPQDSFGSLGLRDHSQGGNDTSSRSTFLHLVCWKSAWTTSCFSSWHGEPPRASDTCTKGESAVPHALPIHVAWAKVFNVKYRLSLMRRGAAAGCVLYVLVLAGEVVATIGVVADSIILASVWASGPVPVIVPAVVGGVEVCDGQAVVVRDARAGMLSSGHAGQSNAAREWPLPRRFWGGGPAPEVRDLVAGICLSVLGNAEQVAELLEQDWVESWNGWAEMEADMWWPWLLPKGFCGSPGPTCRQE